jgi:3-hydroxyacyl-CoA dehydrogenase
MSDLVSFTQESGVGIITVNNPPVNALSPGVAEGILACVRSTQDDESIGALVMIGGGRTFIAGADLKELRKFASGQKDRGDGLHPLLSAIEDSPKPIVCAIHGTALGGGLEVAMACHYRIAVSSAQLGQPEVKLGLIPGAGGTQRLPRLVGVDHAVEMCAGGSHVQAADALGFGLLDRVVEGDLLKNAVGLAQELIGRGELPRRTRALPVRLPDEQSTTALFAAARDRARKRDRGRLAPMRAIEAVEAATRLPFEEGIKKEAELFRECLFSDQSKALIHVFLSEREVAKVPGIDRDTHITEVHQAGVVGAGTMGSGIAMSYANAGIPVVLKDAGQETLERGLARIRTHYEDSVKRGRLTPDVVQRRLELIRPTLNYEGFRELDIVVEAVPEDIALKEQVLADLATVCKPEAILASNTSTLDIDRIAAATSHPDRVIGHHFFAPANVMRLLEIVRGKATAGEVIASSLAVAKKLGKIGVVVGNRRGFVGNRMYHQYQREAQFLVEEGAQVSQVDAALYDFGMAMGPFATADLSGLDVGWRIRKGQPIEQPALRRPLVADRLCELGRFGQKTGAGWYRYEPGERRAIPDPEVEEIIRQCAGDASIPRRKIAPEEIVDRTIHALINEGAKILEEGIALRAAHIDIIYIHGYGFPAHRGGPMWYADTLGMKMVYERICDLQQQHGILWSPAPLLKQLADAGQTFGDFEARASQPP